MMMMMIVNNFYEFFTHDRCLSMINFDDIYSFMFLIYTYLQYNVSVLELCYA